MKWNHSMCWGFKLSIKEKKRLKKKAAFISLLSLTEDTCNQYQKVLQPLPSPCVPSVCEPK